MCGVALLLSKSGEPLSPEQENRLRLGLKSMIRRGPDNQELVRASNCGLVHTRLSILDPQSRSNQPFETKHWLVSFNGEIYNHWEIRRDIGRRYSFITTSDTETLCAGLEIYGLDGMLARIAGMFAIIAMNKTNGEIHLIRDHLGIKPLIYSDTSNELIAASSVKAVEEIRLGIGQENKKATAALFSLGAPFTDETMIKGVFKVRPATCISFNAKGKKIKETRFWSPKYRKPSPIEEIIPVFMEYLNSDVKSSLLLSGGIDSTFLASIYRDRLEGFHLVSPEMKYAKAVAAKYGLKLNLVNPSLENYEKDLRSATTFHNEPLMSLGIPLSVCSAISKSGAKVAISANGADELLLGYPRIPVPEISAAHIPMQEQIGMSFFADQIRKVFRSPENFNHVASHNYAFQMSDFMDLIRGNYLDAAFPPSAHFRWFELQTYVLHDLNPTLDAASMWNSIEVRVPFLDHRIVEFFLSYHADQLISRRHGRKSPLKEFLEKDFSYSFLNRPKLGFSFTDRHQSKMIDQSHRTLRDFESKGLIRLAKGRKKTGDFSRDHQYLANTVQAYSIWKHGR